MAPPLGNIFSALSNIAPCDPTHNGIATPTTGIFIFLNNTQNHSIKFFTVTDTNFSLSLSLSL